MKDDKQSVSQQSQLPNTQLHKKLYKNPRMQNHEQGQVVFEGNWYPGLPSKDEIESTNSQNDALQLKIQELD